MTGSVNKPRWWEDDARSFGLALLLYLVWRDGKVNPKSFYRLLRMIEADIDAWANELERMMACPHPAVRNFAGRIMALQQQGRESFSAPMSALYKAFEFMEEPHYADCVSGDDVSMADPAHPDKRVLILLMPPFQHLRLFATPLRMGISRTLRAKLQNPGGRRTAFWLDEAGQLGAARSLIELYTFARGAGCFAAASLQSIEQAFANFGRERGNELIDSAQYKMFASVGYNTSRVISEMCGTQSLDWSQPIDHSAAELRKRHAAREMLSGGSISRTAAEIEHHSFAAADGSKKIRRELMTPSEVFNSDQVIGFASRVLKGPFLGSWVPTFRDERYSGLILNNPYHGEKVRMPGRNGRPRYVPVIEKKVPRALVHLPQYESGTWRFVKGFKPNLKRWRKRQ